MVSERLLGSLGAGGPTVDTVLDPGAARPGGALTGQVHLDGGEAGFGIEHVTLALVTRVEAAHREGEKAAHRKGEKAVVREGEKAVVREACHAPGPPPHEFGR